MLSIAAAVFGAIGWVLLEAQTEPPQMPHVIAGISGILAIVVVLLVLLVTLKKGRKETRGSR